MDRKPVKVKSYANIAIIKYWGKKDAINIIPATSSISLTLENMYTETEISIIPEVDNAETDVFYLNGILQDKKQTEKVSKVVDLFRKNKEQKVLIKSVNNMPIKACNILFGKNLPRKELAKISKLGSGSSARSFFGPIGAWDKDSGEIYEIKTDLKLAMIMLILNEEKKIISSREGMKLCSETSTIFDKWIKNSEIEYEEMKKALAENDFKKVGELTEKNALAMHETTLYANPSFSYLNDRTREAMDFVKELRKNGEKCYFTMDAGPNVKVLCLEEDFERLKDILGRRYKIIASKTKVISDENE